MYKKGSSQINLSSVFFGSDQSRYTGIALFGTILILCLAILFSSSKIPIDQRLAFIVFILLVSVPSILMSLLELTCIVTGGDYNTRWWCWLLAWVIAIVIIIYCLTVVITLLMSMANFDLANRRADEEKENKSIDIDTANQIAEDVIEQYKSDTNNGSIYDTTNNAIARLADGTFGVAAKTMLGSGSDSFADMEEIESANDILNHEEVKASSQQAPQQASQQASQQAPQGIIGFNDSDNNFATFN